MMDHICILLELGCIQRKTTMYNLHYNVNDIGGENDDDAGWSRVGEDQISILHLSHLSHRSLQAIGNNDDNVHVRRYCQNWKCS